MRHASHAVTARTLPVYLRARKILIVDDEPLIADMLADLLTLHGHNVEKAYSGFAALLIARRFRPDVLICDVIMPGIDGVETASRVRSCVPRCQVVLVTAEISTATVLLDKRHFVGQVDVLDKPVHSRQLLEIIASIPPPDN